MIMFMVTDRNNFDIQYIYIAQKKKNEQIFRIEFGERKILTKR